MTVGERKHFGVTHVTVAACDHNLVTRQPGVHVIGQTQNRINITCNTLISSSFSVTLPQASIYQPAHNEIVFLPILPLLAHLQMSGKRLIKFNV